MREVDVAEGEYRRLGCAASGCEGVHKAQGYCLRHYRQWQRGGVKTDATHCAYCGSEFTPSQAGALYCAKRCKLAAWKAANPERFKALPSNQRKVSAIYAGHCKTCGAAFVSRRERTYCGAACEPSTPRPRVSVAPEQKECRACGKTYRPTFTGGRPSEFCGEACRRQVERRTRRVDKLRRKAAKRAVTVESVDPLEVFARDRWRCKLCGIKTPKSKRGTYEPNAPELDHIIPLARGGEHSYRNTQCACRRCNGLKSDRPMGQLLLMG